MATFIRGDQLSPALRTEVLRRYVHRWTHENARQTYGGKCPGCEQSTRNGRIVTGGAPGIPVKVWTRAEWHAYHVPLITDDQWLAAHSFAVTMGGRLSERQKYAQPAGLGS